MAPDADTSREHPLALLFWSQIAMVYALPVILALATAFRGADVPPGAKTYSFCTFYPLVLLIIAIVAVAADFGLIYAYVVRRARRLPGLLIGAAYAIFAFLAMVLFASGIPSASIAWRDYAIAGNTSGITALLLILVIEVFGATIFGCLILGFFRRWRRLNRTGGRAKLT